MIALTEQERRILEIAAPVAERLGLEIVRLRVMGGRRPGPQIMTERAGGAPTSVEDCAKLSRALSPVFEESDPIKEAYVLEVSTPGIDRPLTRPGDFGRWVGHEVRIELARPLDGRRRFTGTITLDTDRVRLFADLAVLLDVRAEHSASGWKLVTRNRAGR